MNRTLISLILISLFALGCTREVFAQTILKQAVFHDINSGFPYHRWAIKDNQKGYILGIPKEETDSEGLYVDDFLVSAFHYREDDFSSSLGDFFIIKLHDDYSLDKSFVIDNAEISQDIFSGESYILYSMSIIETQHDRDSFPILLNGGLEIPRDGNQGKGVVVVLDNQLNPVYYFIPSTGDIGEVAVDGHMAFLELRIPNNEPFIIINQTDTVYNHLRVGDPNDYGRQTVVLCKYNLLTLQVEWTQRIGNVGYEELREILIDHSHNLVIMGETSSHYFSFNDVDTVINNADHSPFVAKYSPEGDFLSGYINPNDENAYSRALILDDSSNVYLISSYFGNDYIIGDTILIRPGLGRPTAGQGIVTKLRSDLEFDWIMQADGDFERTGFYDLADYSYNQLVLGGDFESGHIIFNGQSYIDDPNEDKRFGFILWINKQNGAIENHILSYGDNRRDFYDIEVDHNGDIDVFMPYYGSDTIFGNIFETPLGDRNGYIFKLVLDPVSTADFYNKEPFISMVPNPIAGNECIISTTSLFANMNFTIDIYDSLGRLVERDINVSRNCNILRTDNWPPGQYWVQVYNSKLIQTQLLIKL